MLLVTQRAIGPLGFFLLLGVFLSSLFGQEKKLDKDAKIMAGFISGNVTDFEEQPISGATVSLLLGTSESDPYTLSEIVSDEKGYFKFDNFKVSDQIAYENAFLYVVAEDKGGRLGGSTVGPLSEVQKRKKSVVHVELAHLKTFNGCLVTEDGEPIVGARICVESARIPQSPPAFEKCVFSKAMRETRIAETDKKGVFSIKGLPSHGSVIFSVHAEEHVNLQIQVDVEKTIAIPLGKSTELRGIIACPSAPEKVSGIQVSLSPPREWENKIPVSLPDYSIFSPANITIQKDGVFEFKDVCAEKSSLKFLLPMNFHYYLAEDKFRVLKGSEPEILRYVLKGGIPLRGKIINGDKGLSDCRITCFSHGKIDSCISTITDKKGNFILYVPPGKNELHICPETENIFCSLTRFLDINQDTTLEPIFLDYSCSIEGIVVDKKGKPIADALITAEGYEILPFSYGRNAFSDAEGKFILPGINILDKFKLRAYGDKTASIPIYIIAHSPAKPIKIVSDQTITSSLKGRVVDENGKPLANALVFVSTSSVVRNNKTEERMKEAKADFQGNFKIDNIWSTEKIKIVVSLKGYQSFATDWIETTAAETYDLEEIALSRSNDSNQHK